MDKLTMDRPIYKFRYKDMTDIAEGFVDLILALFSPSEIAKMTTDELVNKSIEGVSLPRSMMGVAKLASVAIPAGLRLNEWEKENIPPEETMKYLPKILEVNKGFFYEFLRGLISVVDIVPTFLLKETLTSTTPKEESVRKS